MILDLTAGLVANILTGFALAGLGGWVLTIRPRNRANVALAVGLMGTGIGAAANNFAYAPALEIQGTPWPSALEIVTGLSHVVGAVALAVVALVFPNKVVRKERYLLLIPGVIILAFLLLTVYVLVWDTDSVLSHPSAGLGFLISYAGRIPHKGVLIAGAALFALRFRATSPEEQRERGLYALLAAAFAIHPAMRWLGMELVVPAEDRLLSETLVTATALLVVTLLWILATLRGRDSSMARNVAILIPAAALIAALAYLAGWGGASAIARVVGMLLLSYAILRHQLLGIDVKVRWTISKTTLAGIFVAVFFITSEVAQQFFGETLGGPYVGIIAAGLLVFAIAPLSRIADQLAARAIPETGPTPAPARPPPDGSPEAAYRAAVRMAWSDGVLSDDDEDGLAELADTLGLSAKQTRRLRREEERRHDSTAVTAGEGDA